VELLESHAITTMFPLATSECLKHSDTYLGHIDLIRSPINFKNIIVMIVPAPLPLRLSPFLPSSLKRSVHALIA
jgi:hypothetical protein